MQNLSVELCLPAAAFWALWVAEKTWRAAENGEWGEFSQQISTVSLCYPSSLSHSPPWQIKKRKRKWNILTLLIISVWENNWSVKVSKWNAEKSRASKDSKRRKGSRKKMLVFLMVIVTKPSWKSPDNGPSYCTINRFLPLGFTKWLHRAD